MNVYYIFTKVFYENEVSKGGTLGKGNWKVSIGLVACATWIYKAHLTCTIENERCIEYCTGRCSFYNNREFATHFEVAGQTVV